MLGSGKVGGGVKARCIELFLLPASGVTPEMDVAGREVPTEEWRELCH